MAGNEALAEAAIQAGLDAYFGYPITPQNEVPEYMARRMPEAGKVFIQAESELAAINMVFGASATGARAMTSSSSPGISLMQEGISYIAACELPAVIVNIMRGGPGLGSITPSQSDYFQATRGGGHGDYHCIVLGPATIQELVDEVQLSFDLADQYRIPVIILGDGLLGQMMEPVEITAKSRRTNLPEKTWALTGAEGRASRIVRSLMLEDGALERHNLHLQAKYATIQRTEVQAETTLTEDAEIILAAYGTTSRIVRSAMQQARKKGIRAGMIRPITLWPFPSEVFYSHAKAGRTFLAVEMSLGQMVEDVRLAVNGRCPVEFYGRSGGAIPAVEDVLKAIEALAGNRGQS